MTTDSTKVPSARRGWALNLEQLVVDSEALERDLLSAARDLGREQERVNQAVQQVRDSELRLEDAEAVVRLEVETAAAAGKSNAEQRKAQLVRALADLRGHLDNEYGGLWREMQQAETALASAKSNVARLEFEFTALRAKAALRGSELAALTALVSAFRPTDDEL